MHKRHTLEYLVECKIIFQYRPMVMTDRYCGNILISRHNDRHL